MSRQTKTSLREKEHKMAQLFWNSTEEEHESKEANWTLYMMMCSGKMNNRANIYKNKNDYKK